MRFWNLMPDMDAPGDGVLDIDGPIAEEQFWGDEVSSKEFRKSLAGMRNVTVHINSPGGDVMAGAEIYSALREHSLNGLGKVTVIVTALAASAASVVAMAGDEVLISPVAYMMIHNPWSIAMGDAKEMRKVARTLDEISEGLITAYQQRTGKSREQLKRMLENETWMSAQTCVEEGFADGIYGGEIRAAACAAMTTMAGRATPEAVKALCARWDAAHAGIALDAADDPEPEEDPEEPETEETEPDAEAPETEPEKEDPEETDEDEKRAETGRRAAALAAAMKILCG